MSTTSAADLVAHADMLTRQLRHSDVPISRQQWESFDVTVHRLMFELVGPGAAHTPAAPRRQLAVALEAFRAYPEPLRYPVNTQISAEQAATLMSRPAEYFRRKVQRGNLHAVRDGGTYMISTRDISSHPEVTPADFSDPHPIARLACTLGAIADMINAERGVEQSRVMDDAELAGIYTHVLSMAHVAARHAVEHGATADADRPLAIAQYAEKAIDALRATAERPLALVRMTQTSPEPAPTTLNDQLEAAVDHWAKAAEPELARLVPSADVLRMFANQGAHLYAVTHQVLRAWPKALSGAEQLTTVGDALVDGARAFRTSDESWARLTTATQPSHEFVTGSRELFTTLIQVSKVEPDAMPADWDAQCALRDLNVAAEHLATLMEASRTLPDRLIRSDLLFAPARTLESSVDRLEHQRRGQFMAVTEHDAPDLQVTWTNARDKAVTVDLRLRTVLLPAPQLEADSSQLSLLRDGL